MLAFFLIFASACSKDNSDQPKKQEKEKTAVKKTAPLTGLETKIVPPERAVAVTINNHPVARPQSGLSKADVIYELLAEGSVTRFLAIFQSEKPENVGPVRSARDYFIDLAKGYDSLYIAHGYSPEAKQILESGEVDQINGIQHDGTLFKRADFREAPHNSYITFENINKGAQDKGFEMDKAPAALKFLTDQEAKNLEGESAPVSTVSYGNDPHFAATYTYNEEKDKYIRSSGEAETVEYGNNEPVLLDNVIIVEAAHRTIDSKGRQDIDLSSGGQAFVLQKGKVLEAEWKNVEGKILPFRDGQELKLVPGKTWINVVPDLAIVSHGG